VKRVHALLIIFVAIAPRAGAQSALEHSIDALDENARAIRAGGDDLATLQWRIEQVQMQAQRLPGLTVAQPLAATVEARIADTVAELRGDAAEQDRDSAARHAGDLLEELADLRRTLAP